MNIQNMRNLLPVLIAALALAAAPAFAKPHAKPHAKAHAAPAAKPAPKPAPKPAKIEAHVIAPSGPDLLSDMSLGNPNAAITVIEYASASCPHCAAWNEEVWPQFEAKYVATGKVRYIFRELLTSPEEYALSAFLTARCAVARSKDPTSSAPYFAVVDSYFRGQKAYYASHNIGAITSEVKAKTGLTQDDIVACIGDTSSFDAFMKNMNTRAQADDIKSTPTFLVNGQKVEGHDLADLDAAIASAK